MRMRLFGNYLILFHRLRFLSRLRSIVSFVNYWCFFVAAIKIIIDYLEIIDFDFVLIRWTYYLTIYIKKIGNTIDWFHSRKTFTAAKLALAISTLRNIKIRFLFYPLCWALIRENTVPTFNRRLQFVQINRVKIEDVLLFIQYKVLYLLIHIKVRCKHDGKFPMLFVIFCIIEKHEASNNFLVRFVGNHLRELIYFIDWSQHITNN